MASSGSKQAARRKARVKALQGLYQWDLNKSAGNDPQGGQIAEQFREQQDMDGVDDDYFFELLNQTIDNLQALDTKLQAALDRPVAELDPIERSVCRLGTYELAHRLDVPVRVVINEWVEIVKRFGADQGYKYINGVIDKVALAERALEVSQRGADKPAVNNTNKKA